MENKLLYELEYQVNELRKQQLDNIEYNNMTIKELLDLGFDNCFIRLNNNDNKQWFDLGYKCFDIIYENDIKRKVYNYYCNDFTLNEKQLSCMVRYVNDEISDYNYLQVSVELVNESDSKYFTEVE